MYVQSPQTLLRAVLAQADLREICGARPVLPAPELALPFRLDPEGRIHLGKPALAGPAEAAFHLRHAAELAVLRDIAAALPAPDIALLGLMAARVAARWLSFVRPADAADLPAAWIPALDQPCPPDGGALREIWRMLAPLHDATFIGLRVDTVARLADFWPLLAPTEALMQSGGDSRLQTDPFTGLNGYGCSHRPRPWAATFASSTASSCSERGYRAAEAARQRLLADALGAAPRQAAEAMAAATRNALGAFYGAGPKDAVVLAASGTDGELLALALGQEGARGRPITSILIAPEETGSGVPYAVTGRHFAADTACGQQVGKGARIAGFADDIALVSIAARAEDGSIRAAAEIDAAVAAAVGDAVRAGRHVLLHLLDLSKTGILAPGTASLRALCAAHPGAVDVVVDACQARLQQDRVRAYLDAGWMVLVTGSKFFTGPPFAGAVLAPAPIAARLGGALADGLRAYAGRHQFPPLTKAAQALDGQVNLGLALRWQAALAEMTAFAAVDPAWRRHVLKAFAQAVPAAIAANPDLAALPARPLAREALGDACAADWDDIQTIFAFTLRDPATGNSMAPEPARQIYHWLNSDLSAALPPELPPEQRALAARRCHIGQPAPVAGPDGALRGALRISAGARLVSGEPSHHSLAPAARLVRELDDARACLAKISLILRHLDRLRAINPRPSFR